MDYDMLILKNGGRFDFWVTQVDMVREFVIKQKLRPIPVEVLNQPLISRSLKVRERKAIPPEYIPWPFPYPGGLRVPHLHLGDDIYYVDARQWREFSKMALKNLHDKFKSVETVNYDALMNLSEAIEPLV